MDCNKSLCKTNQLQVLAVACGACRDKSNFCSENLFDDAILGTRAICGDCPPDELWSYSVCGDLIGESLLEEQPICGVCGLGQDVSTECCGCAVDIYPEYVEPEVPIIINPVRLSCQAKKQLGNYPLCQ